MQDYGNYKWKIKKMNKWFKKKYLTKYLIIAIILLGAVLRFYNFPNRYSMGEETVRDAVIGIEGARELQLPLTGSFSSLGSFTFGPWYAYQLAFFYLLIPNVYSPFLYLTLISVLYIFIMYRIGVLLDGEVFGLLLAFVAAISPTQIISATHLTSHNNTNLFAALTIWIFLKIIVKKISRWWGFFLGLAIGIGMNLHFQMSGLLFLPLLFLVIKQKRFYFLTAAAGVFVAFIPLLIFELNNHWFTTRNLFIYITYSKNAVYVPNRWLFYLRDFWPAFWGDALGIPPLVAGLIIAAFLVLFAFKAYKRKISQPLLFLFVAFVFEFILLRYYWGPRFFGYLNYFRPFVFIFTIFVIAELIKLVKDKRLKPAIGILFFGGIIFFSLPRVVSELHIDPYTAQIKKNLLVLMDKYPGKSFALYTCSPKYSSTYNSSAFTTLFLLESKHLFNANSPLKLGIKSKCKYPQSNLGNIQESGDIADLSQFQKADLKSNWTSLSF